MSQWRIFKGNNSKPHLVKKWPDIPPWRQFSQKKATSKDQRGISFVISDQDDDETTKEQGRTIIETVNAAIYLRRPILVTGKPGTGKTSLAYAIANELELDDVLVWPINTRTTLQDGLYYYDAIARLQDAQLQDDSPDIGHYIRLGALGTAMYPHEKPRVLLIDEIDKSDIDLPNDLLNLFEEGKFEIPELSRLVKQKNRKEQASKTENQVPEVQTHDGEWKPVPSGEIICDEFPIVIMTSNEERDFPLPFKRRCLPLFMQPPNGKQLAKIVESHFKIDKTHDSMPQIMQLIDNFLKIRDTNKQELATDQLLNAVFILLGDKMTKRKPTKQEIESLQKRLFIPLTDTGNK